MFDTVEMILDTYGHPIFVIPEEPVGEEISVAVKDGGIEFFSGSDCIGDVEIDEDSTVYLIAMQKKLGIIAWDERKTAVCPEYLTHVAKVVDKRNLAV